MAMCLTSIVSAELALAVQALGPDAHDEYLEELHRRLLLKQTKEKT